MSTITITKPSQFSKEHWNVIKLLLRGKLTQKKVKSIRTVVEDGHPSERSLLVRYSIARKLLKSVTNNKKLLNIMLPPKEISDKVSSENAHTRDDKELINVDAGFIQKIMDYRDEDNIFKLSFFLLLITGRRVGEIVRSEFKSGQSSDYIRVNGLLKRSKKGVNDTCEFPPLINVKTTLILIKKFRKMYESAGFSEASFRRELLRHCKKYLHKNAYPHMLRGIFCNYHYKFRNKERKKINTLIQDVLCHESISTSLNYTGYNLIFDKDIIKTHTRA